MSVDEFDLIGPQVGEMFPDIQLPDQSGKMIDLHSDRSGRQAVVVFYRSADW